jgi:hypothetical protein
MMILREWSIGNRAALGVAAVVMIAVGTRLHAMGRGVSDGDVAIAERIELPDPSLASGPAEDSLARLIAAAVSVDPFQPARTRPATRFRARGSSEEVASADSATRQVAASASQLPPAMALQGIARLGNGNALAVLSVRGGTAQLLRVGQSIDDYRLTRVDSSSATLVGTDSTIILHLRAGAGTGTP